MSIYIYIHGHVDQDWYMRLPLANRIGHAGHRWRQGTKLRYSLSMHLPRQGHQCTPVRLGT